MFPCSLIEFRSFDSPVSDSSSSRIDCYYCISVDQSLKLDKRLRFDIDGSPFTFYSLCKSAGFSFFFTFFGDLMEEWCLCACDTEWVLLAYARIRMCLRYADITQT